jgi:hypothetical protein
MEPGLLRPRRAKAHFQFQKTYLTGNGYLIRAVIYFAIWLLLMFLFNRWSKNKTSTVKTGPSAAG